MHSVHIEGFRSRADIEFRPGPGVTVLLGANGAGKSNILHFFEM
ncbi:MAG: AAA family ATPase, partial [Proteobacteria bacterium]|nr:AAA family ATPase [Pseudomonadota bacterium]